MGPKARKKHNKPDHRRNQQKAGQQFNSDFDDDTLPTYQSANAETFLPAKSAGKLKDQPDDQKQLLDMTLRGLASKTTTDEPGATSCQSQELGGKVIRAEEEELRSDAAVSGGYSASDRLMLQIDSLLRDSEFIAPYQSKLDIVEFELKHTDDNVPEPNLTLETEPYAPEMSTTDAGNVAKSDNVTEPYSGASHKVCQSQDAEKLCEVKPLSNLAKADFFLADKENHGDFLKLLRLLNGICCKSEFQHHLCLNLGQQNDDGPQNGQNGLNVHDEKYDTSSVPTDIDNLEDSIQETNEEEIKKLLLSISEVLEKNQFSSAVELTKFLEVVEEMKVVIDQWCHIQNKTKTASSGDNEDQTALDSASGGAKSVNDALAVLKTRPSQILTQLSDSLVLWQEFIETRAELEHELTLEQYLLNSIQTKINCNESLRTNSEAEHDLELVEDKLEDYSEKLTSLRRCNQQLAEILDRSTINSNRSQTGILAGELQSIKDSCSSLRSVLNAVPDKTLSSTQMSIEPKKSFHSSSARTEKSAEDFDKFNFARLVLKMILLLFLIILLLLFVSYFKPHLYHPLNHFRLPVPIHVRHVGTYPPM